ncbi:MAG TPA: hypothetical protein DD456_00715 [Stenotrophomonas sp.]|nr:hypothetical protein [Stenotrophomonas sp.]
MNRSGHDVMACASGLDALDLSTMKTMLDASVDSIMVIDRCGIILAYNQAVLRDFGYAGEELLGRNVSMLMPQPYRGQHDGYLDNYLRTGERKIIGIGREVTGQRKNGSQFPLHLSVGEFGSGEERYFFGICHDISEHHALAERIMHMATYDGLTGCINRQQLVARLDHVARTREQAAVLFIDLDEFKAVNDNHGHHVGDRLLEQVVARLRGELGDGDLLGRMGGDEFIACLLQGGGMAQARRTASAMVRSLEAPFQILDTTVMVGASIGISLFPEHGRNAEELISHADLAMYHIKESRTRHTPDDSQSEESAHVYVFDHRLRERSAHRHALLTRLRQAIAGDGLELYYQPQFNLATLRPCGLEALLRWNDGTHGMVMPGDFIPLAYRHGLMPALNNWVLRRACSDASRLVAAGLLDVPVAVNVSAHSINDLYFIQRVADALRDSGLPPRLLELEITEDMAVDFSPQALRNIGALREMGVALVMDDYGVGFSSLIHLRRLNFSKLKLDRSFIMALPMSGEDASIVRTTLALGHELNLPIVAEGIETRQQLDFLAQHGCQMGQGYWYAWPMPMEELQAWLPEHAGRAEPAPAA